MNDFMLPCSSFGHLSTLESKRLNLSIYFVPSSFGMWSFGCKAIHWSWNSKWRLSNHWSPGIHESLHWCNTQHHLAANELDWNAWPNWKLFKSLVKVLEKISSGSIPKLETWHRFHKSATHSVPLIFSGAFLTGAHQRIIRDKVHLKQIETVPFSRRYLGHLPSQLPKKVISLPNRSGPCQPHGSPPVGLLCLLT